MTRLRRRPTYAVFGDDPPEGNGPSGGVFRRPIGDSHAKVLSVEDGLIEETGHMVVVEGVGGATTRSFAGHKAEGSQYPKLVRDRRLFQTCGPYQLGDARRTFTQPTQDQ